MNKFAVFSGFLGSGKTTTMMALTRYFTRHHGKAAMISNDLGGAGLADNRLANLNNCTASELTGQCICYQTENLTERLDCLFGHEGCELVISDIPGFGIGALDHVYHKLCRDYTGKYQLAPFTVLAEPKMVDCLREGCNEDLSYILRSQLTEADLIVLNKIDLLTEEERKQTVEFLETTFPHARVLAISAKTGEGLEALSQELIHHEATLHKPDVGYGGEKFTQALGHFSEYNIQYYAIVCCDFFDGNGYLRCMAENIRQKVSEAGQDIPHLKLLAWDPEGDFGKVDILGVRRPVEVNNEFIHPCRELAVVLNTTAICPSEQLDQIITGTIEEISQVFRLSVMIYKKECFAAIGEKK